MRAAPERREKRERWVKKEKEDENEAELGFHPFILAPEPGRVRTDPCLVSYKPLDLGLC